MKCSTFEAVRQFEHLSYLEAFSPIVANKKLIQEPQQNTNAILDITSH